MFEWLFGKKSEVEELKGEVRDSFNHVKNDISDVSKWIKHLNSQDSKHEDEVRDIGARLSTIEQDLEGIKNAISLMEMANVKQVFKTPGRVFAKQTAVEGVKEAVQTAVQTADFNLSNFSLMERAIISVLLSQDIKLSYEDLAALTGKSRATIRGQINAIKQKSEGLIQEIIEQNGKKRVFIPLEIKEKLLKNVKVRVSKQGKTSKN